MKDFMDFIREQGVVGLAVGFILGGAVSKLVSALIEDVINPLLGLLLGKAEGLTALSLKVGDSELLLGHLLAVFIDFVVIALVVYLGFKLLKLDKLDKEK